MPAYVAREFEDYLECGRLEHGFLRVNLTRYHGVFAPNSHAREQVTPARRGRRSARPGPVASNRSRAV